VINEREPSLYSSKKKKNKKRGKRGKRKRERREKREKEILFVKCSDVFRIYLA